MFVVVATANAHHGRTQLTHEVHIYEQIGFMREYAHIALFRGLMLQPHHEEFQEPLGPSQPPCGSVTRAPVDSWTWHTAV